MEKFRKRFFEVLLVMLAAAFVFGIRYLSESQSTTVGTFGQTEDTNLTISDVLYKGKGEK